jgi:hypothetical protein
MLSVTPMLSSVVFKSLCDLLRVALTLIFLKIYLPKSKWYQKGKVKVNVLHLSDTVKILDLIEVGMSLEEVGQHYGKDEVSIHPAGLNAMCPKHSWSSSLVVSLEPYTHRYQGFTVLN